MTVLEQGTAGSGASSRAAGIVRAQGGTPTAVALGRWTIDFYRSQAERYGTDSGFRELGYLILAVTAADERDGRERVAMQRAAGLDVAWLSPDEVRAANPTLAPDGYRGGSYIATDGAIDPPRNVRAYAPGDAAGRGRAARADRLRRAPPSGGPARRGRHVRRADRHRAGPPDRWPDPARRGPDCRDPDRGGRGPPPDRGDRATSGLRGRAPADGLRPRPRPLLAARGGRPAVRDEQPGGEARDRPRDRLAVPPPDAAPARAARAGRPRSRPAQGLVRHDRLHPGSPADPRARRSPRPATRFGG